MLRAFTLRVQMYNNFCLTWKERWTLNTMPNAGINYISYWYCCNLFVSRQKSITTITGYTLFRSKRPEYKAQNINEMLKGAYYAYYFISIILLMLRWNRIPPTALSAFVCIAMDFVWIVYRRFGVCVENMKLAMNFDAERVNISAQARCEWCVSI